MIAAFVAGATGFTGREVVASLADKEVQVTAHVRPDSSKFGRWKQHFSELSTEVDSTPWSVDALAKTFSKSPPDIVFALIGTTKTRGRAAKRSGATENYQTIDFGLTAMLIDALKVANPEWTGRFVYLSSVGAGPKARGAYLKTRWKTEEYVRDSGFEHTIVRPSFITGLGRDDRRAKEALASTVSDGAMTLLSWLGGKSAADRLRSINNLDLAERLATLSVDPLFKNQIVEGSDLRLEAKRVAGLNKAPL